MAKIEPAAIGFRVKSGWALAVLVSGGDGDPRAIDRSVAELSDAAFPESRQPYHAATGKEETDDAKIKARVKIVRSVAGRSVVELVERYRKLAPQLGRAALVVGSLTEPMRIANPHIRAHAYEGQLFRTVLQDALLKSGLQCDAILEREIHGQAVERLNRSEADIKRIVDGMGASVGRPWTANEKLAALAGWMALTKWD